MPWPQPDDALAPTCSNFSPGLSIRNLIRSTPSGGVQRPRLRLGFWLIAWPGRRRSGLAKVQSGFEPVLRIFVRRFRTNHPRRIAGSRSHLEHDSIRVSAPTVGGAVKIALAILDETCNGLIAIRSSEGVQH